MYDSGTQERFNNLFIVMGKIYQYKSMAGEIKSVDVEKRTVSGYFSAFDKVDSYGDVVRKGAFAKTIMEQGPSSKQPRIKHLLNHDISQPLGKIVELKEDDYGLFYVSEIGTHSIGEDFLKMVDSGLITEHSIGYQTVKYNKIGDDMKSGVYELTELKLYEGSSLTGWGVNQYTPLVSVSKADTDKIAERVKKLEKFIKSAEPSAETSELLLIEIKQLSQLLSDMSTPAAVEAQEPEKKAATLDASLILTYLSI